MVELANLDVLRLLLQHIAPCNAVVHYFGLPKTCGSKEEGLEI